MERPLQFTPDHQTRIIQRNLATGEKSIFVTTPLMSSYSDFENLGREGDFKFETYRVVENHEGKIKIFYYMQISQPLNRLVAKENADDEAAFGLKVFWGTGKNGELVLSTGNYDFELSGTSPEYLIQDPLLVNVIAHDLRKMGLYK